MIKFVAFLSLLAASAAPAQLPPTPEARAALARFAGCVAKASPAEVHRALTRDFRTTGYRSQMQALARNNAPCVERGMIATTGLPFAGALAEHLLTADPIPLADRLTAASTGKMPTVYGDSDATATCVVRSAPVKVAALIEAPIASQGEIAAATALAEPLGRCVTGRDLEVNPFGLRAILATASYRLLAAQAPAKAERG